MDESRKRSVNRAVVWVYLGGIVAVAGWMMFRAPYRRSYVPPEANVRVKGVTYGRTHSLKVITPERKAIQVKEETPFDQLGVWIKPAVNWNRSLVVRPVLVDSRDREWPAEWRWVETEADYLCFATVPVFPRRERQFRIRVYDRVSSDLDSKSGRLLTEYRFDTPAPAAFPRWQPASLPSSVSRNGARFTLASLTSRTSDPDRRTELRFQVGDEGRETKDWRVVQVELEDPTGNRQTSEWDLRGSTQWEAPGYLRHSMPGLATGETVWKIRARFARVRDLPSSVVLRNVPLPQPGQTLSLDRGFKLAEAPYRLVGIVGQPGDRFLVKVELPDRERPELGEAGGPVAQDSGFELESTRPTARYLLSTEPERRSIDLSFTAPAKQRPPFRNYQEVEFVAALRLH